MEKLLIRKHSDFVLRLDSQFNLIFIDMFNGVNYSFPIILDNELQLDLPANDDITKLLEGRISYIENETVHRFLNMINLSIVPFYWMLMKSARIDLFFDEKSLYVLDFKTGEYIVFNDKNISIQTFDKIYRNQVMNKEYAFINCKEELYIYVNDKIQNGVGHNGFINSEIKGFQKTQSEIEKEFLKNANSFNIKKALFLYEKLIRLKEQYLKEDHNLISEEVMEEISQTIDQIKLLIAKPPTYQIDEE